MLRLLSLVVLLTITQLTFAQIRATTEGGNKVLLFDNGTWKYDEQPAAPVAAPAPAPKESVVAKPAVNTSLKIDATREITTDSKEVFYCPSPRLARFFGEQEGRVRCSLSCSNNLGEVQIHFNWQMQVGDGNRYFGYCKAGTKITLHLLDGQKVELAVAEDSRIVTKPQYNITGISGVTQALTNEQIVALTSQPVLKMEVDWKKKSEQYEVKPTKYFMETLPLVF